MTLARVKRLYVGAALLLLSTGLLAFVANALVAAAYAVRERLAPPEHRLGRIVARHGLEQVALAYPGWERPALLALLEESVRSFENEYEPFTEFRPRPRHGRYVNVSEHGFRLVRNQGPWPPDPARFNIFLFGGSTTFGLGVPDAQAIPSLLGERLGQDSCGRTVQVYNFGRPAYFSRQEGALFEQLLSAGVAPNVAIFIDGLNEFFIWPRPLTAPLMSAAIASSQDPAARPGLLDWLVELPLSRLARSAYARAFPGRPPDPRAVEQGRPTPERVIGDWKAAANHTARVARAYGVRPLFVWQPVPCYKYDLSRHLLFDAWSAAFMTAERMRRGFELLDAERQLREPVAGFLWLADMQENRRENLYLTDMHYRPLLSAEIASRIARHLAEASFLACNPPPS